MIRKKKQYLRPKKAFELFRIKEENVLLKKYGLKNKKEVWKTLAKINYFRRRAKDLASSLREEQEVLFRKLKALGLKAGSIADVLDLKIENLLERRLPTIVLKKKLASTAQQARQLVVHKKILIGEKIVDSPSYIVSVTEESSISIKEKKKVSPSPAQNDSPSQQIQDAPAKENTELTTPQ